MASPIRSLVYHSVANIAWQSRMTLVARTNGALQLHVGALGNAASSACSSSIRRASSQKETYGAPYTNSVRFLPMQTKESWPARADIFVLTLSAHAICPDASAKLPAEITLEFFYKDSLYDILQSVKEKLQLPSAAIILNGRRYTELELQNMRADEKELKLGSLFESTVELELPAGGPRFSVNEGARITKLGSASKRSLAQSYMYVLAGGVATLTGCIWFWQKVLPRENQKMFRDGAVAK